METTRLRARLLVVGALLVLALLAWVLWDVYPGGVPGSQDRGSVEAISPTTARGDQLDEGNRERVAIQIDAALEVHGISRFDNGKIPEKLSLKVVQGEDTASYQLRIQEQGQFRIVLDRGHLVGASLLFEHDLSTPLEVGPLPGSVLARSELDLGVLTLTTGCLVTGSVVDSLGVPVEATVGLSGTSNLAPAEEVAIPRRLSWKTSARAEPRTGFQFLTRIPPGEYDVSVAVPQRLVRLQRVTILPGELNKVISIEVEPIENTIRGTVQDGQGKGLPGVDVSLGNRNSVSALSGPDGEFEIPVHRSHPWLTTTVAGDRAGYEQMEPVPTVSRGTTEPVILTLIRLVQPVLTVFDSLGSPVEDYGIRVGPTGGGYVSPRREPYGLRLNGTHVGGTLTLPRLPLKQNSLLVVPQSSDLSPRLTYFNPKIDQQLNVQLATSGLCEISVVDQFGSPIASAAVRVTIAGGEVFPGDLRTAIVVRPDRFYTVTPDGERLLEIATATTDSRGRCEMHLPLDQPIYVSVQREGFAVTWKGPVSTRGEPIEVALKTGARIRGRLLHPEGLEIQTKDLELKLWVDEDPPFPDVSVSIQENGEYEITEVPDGYWRFWVSMRFYDLEGGWGMDSLLLPGGIDTVDGGDYSRDLEITPLVRWGTRLQLESPVRIPVGSQVFGSPIASSDESAVRRGLSYMVPSGSMLSAARFYGAGVGEVVQDGQAEVPLGIGDYRIGVISPAGLLWSDSILSITEPASRLFTVNLTSCAVEGVIVANGLPSAELGLMAEWGSGEGMLKQSLRTVSDARGRFVFEGISSGQLRLHLIGAGEKMTLLKEVVVPAGTTKLSIGEVLLK